MEALKQTPTAMLFRNLTTFTTKNKLLIQNDVAWVTREKNSIVNKNIIIHETTPHKNRISIRDFF